MTKTEVTMPTGATAVGFKSEWVFDSDDPLVDAGPAWFDTPDGRVDICDGAWLPRSQVVAMAEHFKLAVREA